MFYELLYFTFCTMTIFFIISIILMYYRHRITKFERKYFELFGYYPSYFIIHSNNLWKYGNISDILSFQKKISYTKDENINLIINTHNYFDNCCNLYCEVCCISSFICCRYDNICVLSDLFKKEDVMSTNFKNEDIFNLIEQYKKKLNNLLKKAKEDEWQFNENNILLEDNKEIIDVVVHIKNELEENIETESPFIKNELSKVHEIEKLKKQNEKLQGTIIKNRREIHICREKINELYKYSAKCSLIKLY